MLLPSKGVLPVLNPALSGVSFAISVATEIRRMVEACLGQRCGGLCVRDKAKSESFPVAGRVSGSLISCVLVRWAERVLVGCDVALTRTTFFG